MEEIKETVNEHTCKTCGCIFLMSEDHEKWYEKLGLKIPTHCFSCVGVRKAERAAKAGGQNEH